VHLLWLIFLPAAAYQLLAILSEMGHLRRRSRIAADYISPATPVSVLKPLRGLDPNLYAALASQIQQDYPWFEVIFGARDIDDPALLQAYRLMREFPNAPIRIVTGGPRTPNGKVGLLQELSRHARFPLRVVNDSDIKVTPDYLAQVTAPLADPDVGVVTCPYRVAAHTAPAAWEALGIATDFMPSALVAQSLGVREFGFGSTLAYRAADLEEVGGFQGFADFIADDYQLAKRITGLGPRALLSTYTVETSLREASWYGVWLHQQRWARTIRVSKGAGYAGLPVTQAGLWALLAFLVGAWPVGLALLGFRITSAFLAAAFVLHSRQTALLSWLSPFWDLYSFAVWAASYAGNTVRWRDRLLEIDSQGRIITVDNRARRTSGPR
jgi:ceramide glucosyltransferase